MQTSSFGPAAATRQDTWNSGASPDFSAWDRELDELYAAIAGRGAFRYDANSDPLYAAYADRAVTDGRLAMRDSMGQAAALTGGYGSSYGQAVGQQQYGEYLRSLSEAMPQFYSLAWQRWQDEGAQLGQQYDRLADRRADAAQEAARAEQLAYDRQRDALSDRQRESETALAAEKTAYTRQQNSYAALVKLISASGYRPTDAELEGAGLSREAAEALLRQYLLDNGLLPEQQRTVYAASGKKKKTEETAAAADLPGKGKSLSSKQGGMTQDSRRTVPVGWKK